MGSPTTMGITGFQFITSINTIGRDEETRRKVRSHARRQKLPNEPTKQQSQSATKSNSQKERTSKFRLSTNKASPLNKKDSPKSNSSKDDSPPSSRESPAEEIKIESKDEWQTEMITNELAFTIAPELPNFSVLPIRTTPLTENLFKYMICVCLSPKEKFVQHWFNRCGAPTYFNTYHSSFLSLSHAMNPQGNWFDFITVDPAMTHGFMGLVAAMHNALAEWDDTTTIDHHRYEAVKYINKRLNIEGRDDTMPVSDGIIVAVSLLVNIEAFTGSLASAKAHMMGLKKMVDLRGGLRDGFGYSTLLQRALAWADFAHATASQVPLSLPFIPALASSLGIQDRFLSRSMMLNTDPSNYRSCGLTFQNREAVELFELLHTTTEAVNTFEFSKLEELQDQRGQISDSIYLIEYRLCKLEETARLRGGSRVRAESLPLFPVSSIEGNDGQASENSTLIDMSDALVYASHLFLHMALRGQPPHAKGHRAPVEALMLSLYDTLMNLDLLLSSLPAATVSPVVANNSPNMPVSGRSSMDSWPESFIHSSDLEPSPESPEVGKSDELHKDILLWVLFIGSCVQIRPSSTKHEDSVLGIVTDHRGFFLSALRKYCLTRDMLNKDVLLNKLKDVMWLNSWCEQQLEMVWARIGNELS
ncbi:hypothetical protein BJ170DRAFT_598120 [Xylariales sp. AK1849]|nr:hypothetical protein BJ170DRAFT_598120 [Xylariales sp. AK1849]